MATDVQEQTDDIISITVDPSSISEPRYNTEGLILNETYLTGTLTVQTAAVAAFAAFIMSGVTFSCKIKKGETTTFFSYSGTQSVQAIIDLINGAKSVLFTNNK
jgi:hypothetical protein